jgi:hypothetical protein
MMEAWSVEHPGKISGSHGSPEFALSVRKIHDDPSTVELTLDNIDLDGPTVVSIRNLMMSRKWKSITVNKCSQQIDDIIEPALEQAVRLEIRGGLSQSLASAVASGLRSKSCYLRKMCFNRTDLTLASAATIGEGLSTSQSLEEFALTECHLTSEVLSALLGITTRLRALYLCDCLLQEEQIAQIVQTLEFHPFLKQLWLNGKQNFGDKGALLLLEGLESHTEIEHLQLPHTFECTPQMKEYMDLNRGGRRLLGNRNAMLALWPHVFERVYRIGGLSERSRANIIYFFVQQLHGRERLAR